jgi:hypothetical protein
LKSCLNVYLYVRKTRTILCGKPAHKISFCAGFPHKDHFFVRVFRTKKKVINTNKWRNRAPVWDGNRRKKRVEQRPTNAVVPSERDSGVGIFGASQGRSSHS